MANVLTSTVTASPSIREYLYIWFFQCEYGKRSDVEIIRWWESRRLAFNLILFPAEVLSCGLCSLLIRSGNAVTNGASDPSVLPYIGLFFLLNLLYGAAGCLEVVVNGMRRDGSGHLGPRLLKFGLLFSVGIVLLPVMTQGMPSLLRALHILLGNTA